MLRRGLLLAAVALLSAGCGNDEPYNIVPVSGRVTLNGKPVEKVSVTFYPVPAPGSSSAGPSSNGVTDADGVYTLKLISTKDRAGAVVGKHKVRFNSAGEPWDPDVQPKPPPGPAVSLPIKYLRHDKMLDFEVPAGGTSKADWALTSP